MRKTVFTILALLCAGGLSAQWNPSENRQLTVSGIENFEAKTNKDGITYLAFWKWIKEDPERLGNRYSDNIDLAYYLQIIDKDGNKLFPDEGKLISDEPSRSSMMGRIITIFPDSDGNVLYFVKDERNATGPVNYSQGFYVYKLSPTGEFLWDEPVALDRDNTHSSVFNIDVTQLTNGSYIIAHDVEVNGTKLHTTIESLSKNGALQWETPLVLSDNVQSYDFPFLTSFGNSFTLVYFVGGHGPALGQGILYAQRFAYDKTPRWETPATIYSGGGFTTGQTPMTVVDVISDQNGGSFVAWYDDHSNSGYEKTYVSHILSNGTQGFVTSGGSEGLQVNGSPYMRTFRPSIAYNPDGENLFVAFQEDDHDQMFKSLVLQKVSKQGELAWTSLGAIQDNRIVGLLLASGSRPEEQAYYTIQPAGTGKIAVFYQHKYNSTATSVENAVILLDVSGEQPQYVWEDKRFVFAEKGRSRSFLTSSPLLDNEYFLTFWREGSAIFARKIPLDPFAIPNALPAGPAAGAWTVSLSGRTLSVSNPAGEPIDRIRIYALDGSLLKDFSLNSSGNVSIPAALSQKIAIVKVSGKDTHAVFKVKVNNL
jgi:hypothetical protein